VGTQVVVAQIECRVTHRQGLGHVGILRHELRAERFKCDRLTRGELFNNVFKGGSQTQMNVEGPVVYRLDDEMNTERRNQSRYP
jgi:hypothetical protein